MSEGLVQLRGVSFRYGEGESWGLSLDEMGFEAPGFSCVTGPNGSGKSTLLRIAAGILAPLTGSVALEGQALSDMSRRAIARVMGYLPQETPMLYDYTVEDVVQMGRYAHLHGLGAPDGSDRRAVDRALETVSLSQYRHRMLSNLSGGERRRVLIASVLAQEPRVLLLDEPTSGLDVHHAADIFRLLAGLAADGLGIVTVTHNINLASLFGDRIVILAQGAVRADGHPREVITPEVMRALYGDELLVQRHPDVDRPMVLPGVGGIQ